MHKDHHKHSSAQKYASQKPVILLLFGGQSGEHQISCATAAGVLRAIDTNRWDVVTVGITPEGHWVPLPATPEDYDLGEDEGYTVKAGKHRVALSPGSPHLLEFEVDEDGEVVPGSMLEGQKVDVAFPLLHGPYGEDGTIQGLLELSNVRYVGCGVAASAVCQDKALTKTVLAAAGIEVGEWFAFAGRDWQRHRGELESAARDLGFPVFVKPCRAGSSLGVAKADDQHSFELAVDSALLHDSRIIVEKAASGREIECGVLVDRHGTIHTSELGEIRVKTDTFYDYKTKYFAQDDVELVCPANLDMQVSDRIREVAKRAFEAVQGEGLSRVDFFYDDKTDRLILNEINTMPGFTPYSMYPTMFREAGLGYVELVRILLDEAAFRPVGLR